MRRFLPGFLLALAAFVPFSVGCDLMKKHDGDAGLAVAIVDAGGGLPTAAPTDTTTPAATAAPTLGATTATATPTGTAVHIGDAGKVVVKDAGTVDAAAPAAPGLPTALPPFTGIPGFDAGMLKGFDAGAFKPPWVH